MSYTYHGTTDLIALPNRTVQTFPSGLVRVERSFVCRKDQVARYRNTIKVNEPMPFDDGAPAIDGLYIFPEPQEVVRDDGFVEFRVTAYGRANIFSEIGIQKSSARGTYTYIITTPQLEQLRLQSINELYILNGVLASDNAIGEILTPPVVENPAVFPVGSSVRLTAGRVEYPNQTIANENGTFYRSVTTRIELALDSFSSTNFGRWSEYIIVWGATATVIDLYG